MSRWIRFLVLFRHYSTTPLYVASRHGHHDVVQSLLAAGVDVNKPFMPRVIGAILLPLE